MCRVLGLGLGVTETVQPAAGADAPEQPAAGSAHRGHRDHPQLHVLRRDQPAALGKRRTHNKQLEGNKANDRHTHALLIFRAADVV